MNSDMPAILFVGPTLPEAHGWRRDDLRVLPPARQGDVIDAVLAGAPLIGLIDGVFEIGPSVWHKEILFALERGVVVAGAASLGALRAAELDRFGMIGIGSIYERYASAEINRDDAVMIAHAPAEFGWQAWTISLINMLDTLAAARMEIGDDLHSQLVRRATRLHFKERTWESLVESECPGALTPARVLQILLDYHLDTKRTDALALIAALPRLRDSPPNAKRVFVPRTTHFNRLLAARLATQHGKAFDGPFDAGPEVETIE